MLSETLDCCSHRLDAWITAAAALRLDEHALRRRRRGLFIGAYGWLENLDLRTPAAAGQIDGRDVLHDGADGGFIHAPGLTHAATAGVLRSGRLTHRRGDPNSDCAWTSTCRAPGCATHWRCSTACGRASRWARCSATGSNGVSTSCPATGWSWTASSTCCARWRRCAAASSPNPTQPVQESLAASDVVDGLRLMEIAVGDRSAEARGWPGGPAYIVLPDTWVGSVSQARPMRCVAAIADLERTHDAVADLLLAESVHQFVSGNPARAAARSTLSVPARPSARTRGRAHAALRRPDPAPVGDRRARSSADPAAGLEHQSRRAPEPNRAWRSGRRARSAIRRACAIAEGSDARRSPARALCARRDLRRRWRQRRHEHARRAAPRRPARPRRRPEPLAPIWELSGLLRAALVAGRALVRRAIWDRRLTRTLPAGSPDAAEFARLARTPPSTALRAIAVEPAPEAALARLRHLARRRLTRRALRRRHRPRSQTLVDQATARVVAARTALLARAVPPPHRRKRVVELRRPGTRAGLRRQFSRAAGSAAAAARRENDLWTGALGPGRRAPAPGRRYPALVVARRNHPECHQRVR